MGIAALVLGIISIMIGIIPFCGSIAILPAAIGAILGILDVVIKSKKHESKGIGIAGLILSVVAVIFIMFWVSIIGTYSNANISNEIMNNSEDSIQEEFTILDHTTTSDEHLTYITGTIKNNTKKNYSYVQVEINLYDAEGNLVNSTLDNINNLEADGTWKFKAVATSEFSSYKIKNVIGW